MSGDKYEGYDAWKGWDAREFGRYDADLATYYRRELVLSGIHRVSGLAVFELGFGNGSFAGWCADEGASYVGTETIPSLVQAGRERGFDVHLAQDAGRALPGPGQLDLAVAFDVFEHLGPDQVRDTLRTLGVALRPGGRIIGRVPSGDSPFARAIQYGDLTHRVALGSLAVRQMAAEVGLAVDRIGVPAFPLRGRGFMPFLSRAAVRLARAAVYPLIAKVLMGGGSPVLTPNLLFVLSKPIGAVRGQTAPDASDQASVALSPSGERASSTGAPE